MRSLLGDLPLRPTLAAALILGLTLPVTLVAWREVSERRQTLFDALARDHVRIVETLAKGMQTPIWDVRPETGRPLVDVIMADPRVTAVTVEAPVLPQFLVATGDGAGGPDSLVLAREVVRDGRRIGTVQVEMTTAPLEAEAARQGWQTILTALVQMAIGLLLIFPLLRSKVLQPVRRLVDQSQALAAGRLDEPFDWQRGDELGALGRSFEDSRRALRTLIRDLEQRNAELALREQALSESEELHRLLVDLSPYGILLHDDAGISFMNPAGCRTLGAPSADAIVGHHYLDFIPAADRDAAEARLSRVLGGESTSRVERNLITRDGRRIVVATWGVPFTRGDQHHALVIFVDVTEMKRAEDEIARQREALHQAEKISALGSLLAGVAHELNNPLSVVVGRAIMLGEEDLDPEVAKSVAKIHAAADRCARIVKTFLAMARQQKPARTRVRFDQLIQSSLELLAYGLESAGIDVTLEIAPDLPGTMADPDQLTQVLSNLITNARQAMIGWNGPRALGIGARLDPSGRQILITVTDTGPGIAEEVRGRIFDPFFTTKPEGAGTGIGLAVCRSNVEAHGGTISVEQPAAGGARFVVTLPIVEAGAGDQPGPLTTPTAPERDGPAAGRVLIVDDEAEIRQMLAEILRLDGHVVAQAADGREALDQLDRQRFDLVISDLIMPVLDGPGLHEALRRRDPSHLARLMFITGDTLSSVVRQFLEQAGRPVIEKPFIPEEVRRAVRAAIAERPAGAR